MKRLICIVGGLVMAVAVGASAARGDDPQPAAAGATGATPTASELYQQRTCVACHGKDAKTPLLPEYPRLAGQSAAYLQRQMLDIKSGARANGNTAAMKGIMHLVNEQEIEALAQWLATLK